jgi:hypothetical protein
MTLKEKFKVLNCTDCDMPYCDTKCTILSTRELKTLEKIAEEFAIGFGNFIEKIKDSDIDSLDYHLYLNCNIKELLEIYKKVK